MTSNKAVLLNGTKAPALFRKKLLVQRRRGDPARKGTAGANETICVEEEQGELCSDVGWGDEIDAMSARDKNRDHRRGEGRELRAASRCWVYAAKNRPALYASEKKKLSPERAMRPGSAWCR